MKNARDGQGSRPAAPRQQDPAPEAQPSGNKPVHEIRAGKVKAAVWANETEGGGTRYNVTFTRIWTDQEGRWHDSASFGRDEIPLLLLVAQRAFEYIVDPKG